MADASKAENPRVRKPLTQERLKEVLRYDPATGAWVWLVTHTPFTFPGKIAGGPNPAGYRRIMVDGHMYRATNLAVLYMTGAFPSLDIDHRDCNPRNDRWSNLRQATLFQNHWNVRRYKNNTSGLKGAFFHALTGRWRSQIMAHRKLHYLGLFDTPEEAHAAYAAAAKRLHGEFARTE